MTAPFQVTPLRPRSYRLSGELDPSTADRLREALADDCGSSGDITLDLSALTFLDSAGFHVLMEVCRALGPRGELVLRTPSPEVDRVFEISGIEQVDGLRVER